MTECLKYDYFRLMPVLLNRRWESYAQARAEGLSLSKAYEKAGFKPHHANALLVERRKEVLERINEIVREHREIATQALERATAQVALNRETVLRMLIRDHDKAEAANQLGPAVRATELLGKEIGMFIDRQLRKETADIYEGLSDEQLRELVMERIAKFRVLSAKVVAPEDTSTAPGIHAKSTT